MYKGTREHPVYVLSTAFVLKSRERELNFMKLRRTVWISCYWKSRMENKGFLFLWFQYPKECLLPKILWVWHFLMTSACFMSPVLGWDISFNMEKRLLNYKIIYVNVCNNFLKYNVAFFKSIPSTYWGPPMLRIFIVHSIFCLFYINTISMKIVKKNMANFL